MFSMDIAVSIPATNTFHLYMMTDVDWDNVEFRK